MTKPNLQQLGFIRKNKSLLQNLLLAGMLVLPVLLYFAAQANYTIIIIVLLALMALVMLATVFIR